MGKEYHVSRSTIARWIKEINPEHVPHLWKRKLIFDLHETGHYTVDDITYMRIAHRYTVQRYIRKLPTNGRNI
jgi:transposase